MQANTLDDVPVKSYEQRQSIVNEQEYRYCAKKLVRLLFDYGVVSQVLSAQPAMIVNNRFRRSHSLANC